jgi:hypothetical protein
MGRAQWEEFDGKKQMRERGRGMKRAETTRVADPESAKTGSATAAAPARGLPGGLAGWLLGRMRGIRRAPARLAVLERITLAPRQSLSLIEAEGRRFLVATSPEGTPAFYALDGYARLPVRSVKSPRTSGREAVRNARRAGVDRDPRVSW